jgi:hypothetical protein
MGGGIWMSDMPSRDRLRTCGLALLTAFAVLCGCLVFGVSPAGAAFEEPLKPAVDPLPPVEEVPLKPLITAPPPTVDTTARTDATDGEDSDVQQTEDDQSALDDAIRSCLIKALGELAASLGEGQTPDFEGLASNLVSCMREELFGSTSPGAENEEAVQTLGSDLGGQVDQHANEVVEAGATSTELAAWLTDTANSLPGGQPATTTTSPVPATTTSGGPSSHGSSFPWVWVLLGVVVVGGAVALGRK